MDFKNEARTLFTACAFEENRVRSPHADPRSLSEFKELETVIAHSLRKPNLIRTQTPGGITLPAPKMENRGLKDEAILKRLLQYRAQVPTSSRIIRKKES